MPFGFDGFFARAVLHFWKEFPVSAGKSPSSTIRRPAEQWVLLQDQLATRR